MSETTQIYQRRCRHCGTVLPLGLKFCSYCGASTEQLASSDPLLDQVRDLFGADLEIEREIGRGGMAVVYAGFDPALQRRVAVKVLLPDLAENPDLTERFRREARMVAALQHPNVVSVYSVRGNDVLSAIVMQFVEGRSLDIALDDQSTPPLPVAGLILAQVASALQHAHERGIVHRDVKPANVLLGEHGRAVVSDFGIARRDGGPQLTGTGVIMGTIAYMSPEQCTTGKVTPAADQYSFGVMAFEVLTGRLPFSGTIAQILNSHLTAAPPSLAALRPDLPAAVAAYVMRTLEKAPEARHPSLNDADRIFRTLVRDSVAASTVVAAMSHVKPRLSPDAVTVVVPAVAPAAAPPAAPLIVVSATISNTPPAARVTVPTRRRLPKAVIGAAVGVVFLGVAAVVMSGRPAPTRAFQRSAVIPPPASADSNATGRSHQGARAMDGEPATKGSSASSPRTSPSLDAKAPAPVAATQPIGPAGVELPARDAPAPQPAAARGDSVIPSQPSPPSPSSVSAAAAASLADARAVSREFVTLCNQRRASDIEQLASLDGDAALRSELLRLVRNAPEFGAGFDRVASAPLTTGDRFVTEFVLDLQWRGGHKLATVRLQAISRVGGWRISAFGLSSAD